jgi:hypothetical protein
MAMETIQHQSRHTTPTRPSKTTLYNRNHMAIRKIQISNSKKKPSQKSQYTLPLEILDLLIETFKITTSYFSSPITCSTKIDTFYSLFQRDSIFGSKGSAYTHKWQNIGYAHPHNTENTHKAIHWARLAAQENQNTITILAIPDEEWTTNNIPYKTKFDEKKQTN